MKKLFTIIALMIITLNIFAQAPNKMSYQTVIRNTAGNLVASQPCGFKCSILQGTASGMPVYEETQNSTTNANGLASLIIGDGTVISGSISGIDWSTGPYFIKTEIDPNGGTSYSISGTNQLLSVPYALSSGDNHWLKTDTNISNANIGNVGIGTTTPSSKLTIHEGNTGSPNTVISVSNETSGFLNSAQISLKNSSAFDRALQFINWNSSATATTNAFTFLNNATSQILTIQNGGNVGIGTTNPVVPLHVNGISNVSPGSTYLYNSNGVGGIYTGSHGASILANGTIIAANFAATSDARIKKVIRVSNSSEDLKLLNKIKITDYTYIDKVANGTGITKKVIAQEVEQVLPNAVSKSTNFVPNVYALSTKTELVNGKLQFTMAKSHKIKVGDKLKWIDEKEQEQQSLVTAIVNPYTIEIDYATASNKVFVYGIEVNDFRTVDYEAIAMLNVSATQELLKRIELLEKENGELKDTNALYHAKISSIESKLNLLLQTPTTVTAQK